MNEIGFPELKLRVNLFCPSLITININKSENEIMINSETMKRHWVKSLSIRSYCSPYFPAFGLDTERYFISLLIQSEYGKIRTRITRDTDTFYAVRSFRHFKIFFFIPGVKELHLHGRQIILLNFDSLFKVIKLISSFLEQIILNLMISWFHDFSNIYKQL